jgi:hypothetical protein
MQVHEDFREGEMVVTMTMKTEPADTSTLKQKRWVWGTLVQIRLFLNSLPDGAMFFCCGQVKGPT